MQNKYLIRLLVIFGLPLFIGLVDRDVENAIGVAADFILNNVVSIIVGISNPIEFLISENIKPETPPIIRGFLIIPSNADFRLLFSESLKTYSDITDNILIIGT